MISGSLAKKNGSQHGDEEGLELEDHEHLLASPASAKKRISDEDDLHHHRPSSRTSNRSKATTIASHQSQLKKSETVPLTGLNLRDAVTYLIRYLTEKRQKLARRLNTGSVSLSSSTKTSEKSTLGDEDDLMYQASLVDTSLLKSYMMTNDALVGPLLRVQNHCDVEECENILMDKKVSY
jgi:hypothetical protein